MGIIWMSGVMAAHKSPKLVGMGSNPMASAIYVVMKLADMDEDVIS